MDLICSLNLLPKIYYSGAILAKSSHILPGQKYSLSIQDSLKGADRWESCTYQNATLACQELGWMPLFGMK